MRVTKSTTIDLIDDLRLVSVCGQWSVLFFGVLYKSSRTANYRREARDDRMGG